MPEKPQMNSATSVHLLDKFCLRKNGTGGAREMKGVQKGKLWEIQGQVTSDLPAPIPKSAQCRGLPAEEGMACCPMGCSGQAGLPGFSGGAKRVAAGSDYCGWLALRTQQEPCPTEEFGSHPSANSRQKVKKESNNLAFKLISEARTTQILKSKS